ncbi:MAG: hypothetical protein Q9179_003577 [Wetmoreana sp. 5 TL-2023]
MPLATADFLQSAPTTRKTVLSNRHTRFQRIIEDIQDVLGPTEGITSSENVRFALQNTLEKYRSVEDGWHEFAFKDASQTFTRNLVAKGNGNYNLVRLLRAPESPLCGLILKGSLTETRYAWPNTLGRMQITKQTNFNRDEVTYMADNLGLHKISNPDLNGYAVSLHLYTPPNAATEGCNVFDAETGKTTHVKVYNYHSEFGKKCGK